MCLWLTGAIGKSRHEKIKKRRLAAAAAFCGVLDAVALFLLFGRNTGNSWLFPTIALPELFLGVWIAYGRRNLLQNSVLLFVITALFAGCFQIVPVQNAGLFCFLGSIIFPFIKTGADALFRAKQTQGVMYEVSLSQNGREKQFHALMDTGNRLRLYGSRIPVIIVDEMYLAEWMKDAEEKMPQKLVFLPYRCVGGKGMMHGVRLWCVLHLENGEIISGEAAAVAAEHRLFDGCVYQMILQPEVLKFPARREKGPEAAGGKKMSQRVV